MKPIIALLALSLLPGCGSAEVSDAAQEDIEEDVVVDDSAPLPVDLDGMNAETGEGDMPGAVHDGMRGTSIAVSAHDTVTFGDVALLVPEIGEGVAVAIHHADGTAREIEMRHAPDGVVEITHLDPEAKPQLLQGASGSPRACSDRAFRPAGFPWKAPYSWKFRAGTTPRTNRASGVEAALKEAAGNITASRTDCGLKDIVSAQHVYAGRTTRATNIISSKSSIKCGGRDGHNVVAFGVLPRGTLGVACRWWSAGAAVEADVKLNDLHHRWYAANKKPSGCRSSFSVEAVATHEFGHVFGLGHVSEGRHGNLTMSTHTGPCSGAQSSLGLGDVLGLRSLY